MRRNRLTLMVGAAIGLIPCLQGHQIEVRRLVDSGRALLEGIAFKTRLHTDGVEADTGIEVTHFLTTGRGSRSATWSQLIADVTGGRLDVCAESEITALGAAMLAACAVGVPPDLATAPRKMARTERTVTPRPIVAENLRVALPAPRHHLSELIQSFRSRWN